MNDTRSKAALSLVAVVALLFAFGLGAFSSYVFTEPSRAGSFPDTDSGGTVPRVPTAPTPGATPGGGTAQDLNAQMQTFYEIVDLLQKESYYRPTDSQKLVYGATEGMMKAVGDEYTRFLTPEENAIENAQLQGESFGGIGVYFKEVDNLPTIVGIIPNTPAAKAGLRPKDVILKVDGRDITTLTLDDIRPLIRGKEGTQVRLTILRGKDAPFDVDVTRAIIDVPLVSTTIRPDGVAVFAVSSFGDKTNSDLDAGIREAKSKGAKAVILDLRNNGGGLVDQAQQMIGHFVSPTVGKKYDDTALYESFASDGSQDRAVPIIRQGETVYDLPVVVLMNGGTASASEIVAGALSDYGRATLMGEQSFGKGSVQSVHTFSDGSSARITIAHWLTPKKQDINPHPTATPNSSATPTPLPTFTPTPIGGPATPVPGVTLTPTPFPVDRSRGIAPDIEVAPPTSEDYAADRDPQLERAAQFLLTGK